MICCHFTHFTDLRGNPVILQVDLHQWLQPSHASADQSGREVVSNFDLLPVDKRQTLHPNARLTPKCLVGATVDERLVLKGLRRIKNKHRLASYEWYQLWQGKICLQFQISTHFFWGHFESDKNMILLWYEFVVMSKKRFLFCFFSFSRTAALVL